MVSHTKILKKKRKEKKKKAICSNFFSCFVWVDGLG